MQQLTGRASSFLNFETPTAVAHTGSVSLFDPLPDGTLLTAETVRALFNERSDELPQYRRRLVPVPLGLDRPYWVEDAAFDLEYHVRVIAVPAPGDLDNLAELISRLHARPLDRAHPLWEVYLIEGLATGQVAWYTKTHHACLDSYTGAEIMNALLDRHPAGRASSERVDALDRPATTNPGRVPTGPEMLGRSLFTLARRPRAVLRLQRSLARSTYRQVSNQIPPLLETIAETLDRSSGFVGKSLGRRLATDGYLSRPALVAPRLSFNGALSAHRRVAFGTFPFDDLKTVKNWAQEELPGTTINDVVMAMSAGALRTWLHRRQEAPGEPLLALVPVSVRDDTTADARTERVAGMIAALPTNEPDAFDRLRLAHEAMSIAKDEHAAVPAELLADLGDFAPPVIAAGAAQLVSRLSIADRANPRFNVVISNIPGPQRPRYVGGHLQAAAFPVPIVSDGAGLNITLLSYAGQMYVGVIACRDAVEDLSDLIEDLGDSLAELVELTTTSHIPNVSKEQQ
nr:putative wax ester synthase/acyl-CoA:diacylglycerol acyltransferase [uncultured bacterium]